MPETDTTPMTIQEFEEVMAAFSQALVGLTQDFSFACAIGDRDRMRETWGRVANLTSAIQACFDCGLVEA